VTELEAVTFGSQSLLSENNPQLSQRYQQGGGKKTFRHKPTKVQYLNSLAILPFAYSASNTPKAMDNAGHSRKLLYLY
jgi:hypothetical protein